MSSAKGLDALNDVRDVIASYHLPFIKQRKFNGIFNAMAMQIEDDDGNREAVEHLGKAVLAVAKGYRLDTPPVEEALDTVYQSLKKEASCTRRDGS
jgi:hypothetical protein